MAEIDADRLDPELDALLRRAATSARARGSVDPAALRRRHDRRRARVIAVVASAVVLLLAVPVVTQLLARTDGAVVLDRPEESDPLGAPDEPGDSAGPGVGWRLVAANEDRSTFVIDVGVGSSSCNSLDPLVIREEPDVVRVTALVRTAEGGGQTFGCTSDDQHEQVTVELSAPLGDRRLEGCGRQDCATPESPRRPSAIGAVGTGDVVVVAGCARPDPTASTPVSGLVGLDSRDGGLLWASRIDLPSDYGLGPGLGCLANTPVTNGTDVAVRGSELFVVVLPVSGGEPLVLRGVSGEPHLLDNGLMVIGDQTVMDTIAIDLAAARRLSDGEGPMGLSTAIVPWRAESARVSGYLPGGVVLDGSPTSLPDGAAIPASGPAADAAQPGPSATVVGDQLVLRDESGAEMWRRPLPIPDVLPAPLPAEPVIVGGTVVIGVEPLVHGFDLATGELRWTRSFLDPLS